MNVAQEIVARLYVAGPEVSDPPELIGPVDGVANPAGKSVTRQQHRLQLRAGELAGRRGQRRHRRGRQRPEGARRRSRRAPARWRPRPATRR